MLKTTQKKAQATLFIIIGIIVVVGTLGSLFYHEYSSARDFRESYPQIKVFVEGCIKEGAKEAIRELSLKGGILEAPMSVGAGRYSQVSYYLYQSFNLVPTLDMLEESLDKLAAQKIDACIDGFSAFDLNIRRAPISLDSKITPNSIILEVDLPVEIAKGNSVVKFDKFNVQLNSLYGTAFAIAQQSVDDIIKNKDQLCITCILDELEQNELVMHTYITDPNTLVFLIEDPKDAKLVFMFSVLLDYIIEPSELELAPVDTIKVPVGHEFLHWLEPPTDIAVSFKDSTDLFDITDDGWIRFTARPEDIGQHIIAITMLDLRGNYDSEIFILDIYENHAPEFDDFNTNYLVGRNEPFELRLEASDPDGDRLYYETEPYLWQEDGLENFDLNYLTGTISWNPTVADEYNIPISVSDGFEQDIIMLELKVK